MWAGVSFGQVTPESVLDLLREQDAIASVGSRTISCVLSGELIEQSLGGRRTSRTEATVSSDGKEFLGRMPLANPQEGGPSDIIEWSDGKWRLQQIAPNSVVLPDPSARRTFRTDPDAAPDGLGPLFCLGRGLSLCLNPRVTVSDSIGEFVGEYASWSVTAQLDLTRGAVATRIVLKRKGSTSAYKTYTLSDVVKTPEGFWYARRAAARTPALKKEFRVEALSCATPRIVRPKWFDQGVSVTDMRAGGAIGYEYDDLARVFAEKEPTLDELYRISQDQRSTIDARKREDRNIDRSVREARSIAQLKRVAWVCVAAFGTTALLVWARRVLRKL